MLILGHNKFPGFNDPEFVKQVKEAQRQKDGIRLNRLFKQNPPVYVTPYLRHNTSGKGEVPFLVMPIIAKPSYGKTILGVNILVQKAKEKEFVLAISPKGAGDYAITRHPNFNSLRPMMIPDLTIIENFSFLISDFNQTSDWQSLGFTEVASHILCRIAVLDTHHHDNPEKFLEILRQLPETPDEAAVFHAMYGIDLEKVHRETKPAMINWFINFKDAFLNREDPNETRRYVPDWGEFWYNHRKLLVSLDMRNLEGISTIIAQAFIGKVFQQVSRIILDPRFKVTPFILVDEADYLAPKVEEGRTIPSSSKWISTFIQKGQSEGIEICLMSQSFEQINSTIIQNAHVIILGHVFEKLGIKEVDELWWDPALNYREFLVIFQNKKNKVFFIPDICFCSYIEGKSMRDQLLELVNRKV